MGRAAGDPRPEFAGNSAQSGAGAASQEIAIETGLEHRPKSDGLRVAGIYWRRVMLGQ